MTHFKQRFNKSKPASAPKTPAAPPARAAALAVLTATLDQGSDAQEALDLILDTRELSPRDRGLTTELVYGYLRLKARLDFVLRRFLLAPEKLPPELLRTLGLACYELFYLDRIPDYASLDWAVNQASADFGQALGKLANAVLRKVTQEKDAACDPGYYRNSGDSLQRAWARYYSCPEWIVRLWVKEYGQDKAQCFLRASAAPPLLGLRVNLRMPGAEELLESLAASPDCRARNEAGLAFPPGKAEGLEALDALLAEGRISRQSLAAQEALLALDPDGWRPPVWDACAGRGGKACLLLERGIKPVWASDAHRPRLLGLRKELARLGLTDGAHVFLAAADRPLPFKAKPRTILLDVPCSGLGVLSRRPDAKWRRTPQDLKTLAATQTRLLHQAFHALAPGGLLAYLTCTLNPDENERCVQRFLADMGGGAQLETTWETPLDASHGEFFWVAGVRKR
jgi:16S rRNA (cytosine967-C5)-methyltransferase